jgi:hypothetical protein
LLVDFAFLDVFLVVVSTDEFRNKDNVSINLFFRIKSIDGTLSLFMSFVLDITNVGTFSLDFGAGNFSMLFEKSLKLFVSIGFWKVLDKKVRELLSDFSSVSLFRV